jgi:serine/threonine protein kinase
MAQFELEAKAASVAPVPHLLRTLSSFRVEEAKCLVREFVVGVSLEELTQLHIRTGWRDACSFVFQTAVGLEHIHRQGWIHRDISPSNLLVDRNGRLNIVDMGRSLANGMDDIVDPTEDRSGWWHSNIGFPAPEQAICREPIDARADIYSLGCTFYFALTGSVPHPMLTRSEKLRAHRIQHAEPVTRLAPKTPRSVANIVEKMMAKEPQKRFQTAAELVEVLAPFSMKWPVHFDFQAILAARRAKVVQRLHHISKRLLRNEGRMQWINTHPDRSSSSTVNEISRLV